MKVAVGKGRYLISWGRVNGNIVPSLTLMPAVGEPVDLPGGRVTNTFIEFYVPAEYITKENLPMTVQAKSNGNVIQTFKLDPIESESESSDTLTVTYDNGWPNRPTNDWTKVVTWVGGSPDNPPPGAAGGIDLWMVPYSG